jgi:hypothetical protein
MRVEAVEALSKRAESSAAHPAKVTASLPAKNFLSAIASDDSLFILRDPLHEPTPDSPASPHTLSADIVLAFKQSEFSRQKGLHLLLMEKLMELLKQAGSQDVLDAKLCLLTPGADAANRHDLAFCIRLAAHADSHEQALLRWGLGLAHVQQALLFASRQLRQHLKQNGS